jgi:hypothetical protein
MKSKWLVALAFLFLAAAACICETTGGDVSTNATEVIDTRTEVVGEVSVQEPQDTSTEVVEDISEQTMQEVVLPTLEFKGLDTYLTCSEIKEQFDRYSAKEFKDEWASYTKSIIGLSIVYEGKISSINDDGKMLITYACPPVTVFSVYGTPNDVLSLLSEEQFITGIGTIGEVTTILGILQIKVDGEKIGKAIHSEEEIIESVSEQTQTTIEAFIIGTEEEKAEPDVYTCDFINNKRKSMTELQWNEYTETLVGKRIKYVGSITEVYSDGRIQISACSGLWSGGPFIVYGTPLDIARNFSKGQIIQGEGTIKEVGTFILMYIHVYGETIE